MKKLIFFCLIITSLFVISCKNGSNSSSSGSGSTPATQTTPLEGKWSTSVNETLDLGGGATLTMSGSESFIFAGTAITNTESITLTTTDSSSTSTSATLTLNIAGTFRLDSGKIYTTFKTASLSDGSTTITNVADIEAELGQSLPPIDNTEHLYGAYAVNGNILTITPDGSTTPQNYTKQ